MLRKIETKDQRVQQSINRTNQLIAQTHASSQGSQQLARRIGFFNPNQHSTTFTNQILNANIQFSKR